MEILEMIKFRGWLSVFAACAAVVAFSASFEHAVFESVPLDGEWEMAYSPYEHRSVVCPEFTGVRIPQAIPGYWEDMREAFRAAGMTDEFRINPWYEKQTFPIAGQMAELYACGAYERIYVKVGPRVTICYYRLKD